MNEEKLQVDLSTYKNALSRKNQIARFIWSIVWVIFARPIPRSLFNSWKLFLLRLFGARVHKKSVVYSSAIIYMPWNLEMEEYACLGPEVDCYNVGLVKIGSHTTVSQKSYLCSAIHYIEKSNNPLVIQPINVADQAWIVADVFVGPGVTIGQGAFVGARASVLKNVEPWTVVGGNPAKFIKRREIIK